MTDPDFWFVLVFVDGIVKHGYIEDTTLRISTKAMDTVRYAMVRDVGQTPEEAVAVVVEEYEPDVRERCRTARVGRMSEPVEVRL